jgi:GNAT superfamily N-acetyltransferase
MTLQAGLALLERIQRQMREVARRQYEAVPVPPFTLFFHATDPLPYFNYAIPDGPGAASGSVTVPLDRLAAEFHGRHRVPRFEFVEACAPRLAEALEAHGFALENRAQLMVCPRGKERAAPAVNGLDIATLDAATALEEFVAFLDVQRRAFGLPFARPFSDEEALNLRETLGDGFAFLARIAGEPVATAMIQPPHDGLSELVGVSTLEAFRRRGIGGFLSFAAVRAAFARGASLAFLSAADARAGRVYEAAGFSPAGHSLFYRRPEEPEPSFENLT